MAHFGRRVQPSTYPEPQNMSGQVFTNLSSIFIQLLHQSSKIKFTGCAFPVPIKCPPGIANQLRISGCQPDIHSPAAEATESIPPECFRHRRDCPLIHATRNTVIPCVRGHYVSTTICLPTPCRPLPSMVHEQLLVVMRTFLSTGPMCIPG